MQKEVMINGEPMSFPDDYDTSNITYLAGSVNNNNNNTNKKLDYDELLQRYRNTEKAKKLFNLTQIVTGNNDQSKQFPIEYFAGNEEKRIHEMNKSQKRIKLGSR